MPLLAFMITSGYMETPTLWLVLVLLSLIAHFSYKPANNVAFISFINVIIAVVLSINEKHTLPVHMPTISPFGIDGNHERMHYFAYPSNCSIQTTPFSPPLTSMSNKTESDVVLPLIKDTISTPPLVRYTMSTLPLIR